MIRRNVSGFTGAASCHKTSNTLIRGLQVFYDLLWGLRRMVAHGDHVYIIERDDKKRKKLKKFLDFHQGATCKKITPP